MKKAASHLVKLLWVIGCAAVFGTAGAQSTTIPVHDPCIIKEDSTYYIFATGRGIAGWSSPDLVHWHRTPPVFTRPPRWITRDIPGFRNSYWAPDISFYRGTYYLYYAASVFGKNISVIGLATNKTLDPGSPLYHWQDRGMVVRSVPGRDLWNAIDPNLITDSSGTPWLDFGSFWDGIKLVKLTGDRTRVDSSLDWSTIASRPRTPGLPDTVAGDGAIEGPYIFHRGDYYYLFVSWDYCCRGIRSNYKVAVGRSHALRGPYVDKQGVSMTRGGGTLVLTGNARWPGVGHNAVLHDGDQDYLVCHGYDATDNGRSKLLILPMSWDKDGWPTVAPLP